MGLLASDNGFGLGSADTIGLTSLICVGYVISVVVWDTLKKRLTVAKRNVPAL